MNEVMMLSDCWSVNVVDIKCDRSVDLTSRYLWCQRLSAAESFRDFDNCRHRQCCLLADRLRTADIALPGSNAVTDCVCDYCYCLLLLLFCASQE